MKLRLFLGLLICISGFFSSASAYSETFQYQETVERGDDYISRWTVEERNGRVHLTIRIKDSVQRYVCTYKGAVLEFAINDPDTDTDFIALRSGNTVSFNGKVNGRRTSKEFSVNGAPWGQPIAILLQRSFTETADGLDFWILNINKIKPMYLQAKRVATEEVSVFGKQYQAHRFEVRLQGALSAFWVSNYWLHEETGDFIKFHGDFGPGSSEITMELMDIYE